MAHKITLSDQEDVLIVLPFPEPTAAIERLLQKYPKFKVRYVKVKAPQLEAEKVASEIFKNTTILVTLFNFPSNPEQDAPKLKLVHVASAGVDHIAKEPLYTNTNIPITTCNGIHGPQISEWIIMTTLVHSHSYNAFHDLQKQAKWDRRGHENVRDLVGQRIGILGYGGIGRQAARVARAMGMEVLAYTASPRPTKESRKDTGYVVPGTGDPNGDIPVEWFSGVDKPSLHNFLSQDIDILVVAVPLTAATTHFLAKEEFELLGKRKAFVSNISRGSILNQSDLMAAVKSGTLRGAALDVTDPEPLPDGHPLWSCENIIVTPHISGKSEAYTDRVMDVLEANLLRLAKGEKLINYLDRKIGY